jgi:NADPH-dependent 2,4-dienoyl-CoA reductase/sulfur reductase-like enzyme
MEQQVNRREFVKMMGIGSFLALTPLSLKAQTIPHVIVVGGGFAGATCAKYLKLWGGSDINVTLIEPNSTYNSPILSNLVLNGERNLYTFNYDDLASKYGVTVVTSRVEMVNGSSKSVTLSDGSTLTYDRVVLAPGIDFIQSNAYDMTKVPHAWIAGEQTTILKAQIDAMQDGDSFVMTIPQSPYRCPPGPYERACVVADYLKNSRGFSNARVIVLDENADIVVEKESFSTAFSRYGIEYHPSSKVSYVDDSTKSLTYEEGGSEHTLQATVLNVIPNHKAGKIIFDAGLNSGNFAPVDLRSYESTLIANIHIIGDSHLSTQPKAGHIANSEAKICADAVLRLLNGHALVNPKTNSACYSPISKNEATWLSAVYSYDATNNSMVMAQFDSGIASTKNYNDMFMWSGNLFSDTFS